MNEFGLVDSPHHFIVDLMCEKMSFYFLILLSLYNCFVVIFCQHHEKKKRMMMIFEIYYQRKKKMIKQISLNCSCQCSLTFALSQMTSLKHYQQIFSTGFIDSCWIDWYLDEKVTKREEYFKRRFQVITLNYDYCFT